ncbi:MAG: cobalamin-binding protein [Spirochaetaceae bacterium]|nr:cobalamin-binding protein [Spirochaetaceae bacterium]
MQMRKSFLFLFLGVIFTSGLSGQSGFPLILRDSLGRSVTVQSPPKRIVSLSPGITEILFAITAGDQVVGVTQYCNFPPEAQSRRKVGGFSGATISVESIVQLQPDLVILSGYMHERLIPLLERFSIPIFAVEPQTFAEVYKTIEALGKLTGKVQAGAAVLAEMQEKIRRAEARRAGRERPGVFWELADEPLMTAGGDTFISEAISLAGGRNVFADRREQWPAVNTEQVLLKGPDWIIAGDDHGKALDPQALARRPGWSKIPAVQNRRIALVSADCLYRYGPRLADAVLALADIFWGSR